MKIQVTQEDIDKALSRGQDSYFDCPVALALNRSLNANRGGCKVGSTECTIYFKGLAECVWLPEEATNFINSYDSAWPVTPFEFELDLYNTANRGD